MADNFTSGEADAYGAVGPPITQEEPLGARLSITVAHPGPISEPTQEPYLMPSVAGRHGSMEKVSPSIVQTPLGGMVPGPFAIPPATVVGTDYRAPVPDEDAGFFSGITDGYPEGAPIPFR